MEIRLADSARFAALVATSRPRVMAGLLRYFEDLEVAEDAFQEACLKAMNRWPVQGEPRDPTAWLMMVARNAGLDLLRRTRRSSHIRVDEDLVSHTRDEEEHVLSVLEGEEYRDDVLHLLFMCCHPELSVRDQLALALKFVVGLRVPEIARLLLVNPKAMEQRLTRARKKAALVAPTFQTPSPEQRLGRLSTVSRMIYALFNEGYVTSGGSQHTRDELCLEAIYLARLLLRMYPAQPEVMGLLALFLLNHARRDARTDGDGNAVRLEDQDRSKWDQEAIAEGRVLVEKALRKGRPGSYQLQAAIAAVHCEAPSYEDTDWSQIARLYSWLEELEPTPVVALNHAVAVSMTGDLDGALVILRALESDLSGYRYYHAALSDVLARQGNVGAALRACHRALALDPTDAESRYLRKRVRELELLHQEQV